MAVCPILKAGTMLEALIDQRISQPGVSRTVSIWARHKTPECLGERCEWFEQGCPAHPGITYYI